MYIYEIFLFVVLLVMDARASVIVTTNNTLQGTYLSAQIFYQGLNYPFPNVTGLMTLEVNPDNRSNPYIAGNIVLTSLHLPAEPTLRKFQSLGAIAVVMQGYFLTPGVIMYFGDNGNTSDIKIPVSELWVLNYSQFVDVLSTTTFVNITLTSAEPNLWKITYESPWIFVFQFSLEAFSLSCLILAIYRWAQFYEFNGGFRFNVPQVCFALTVAGTLIRIVADLDPQGMRQLFNRGQRNFRKSVFAFCSHPLFSFVSLLVSVCVCSL
jgi:hypothetical protein